MRHKTIVINYMAFAINVFAVLRNRHFVDAGLSAGLRHRAKFFNQVRNAGNQLVYPLITVISFLLRSTNTVGEYQALRYKRFC